MRTGLVLVIVGVWVVLRSVVHDANGNTLIDRILGKNPGYQHGGGAGAGGGFDLTGAATNAAGGALTAVGTLPVPGAPAFAGAGQVLKAGAQGHRRRGGH